nr:uncharacterized protein LOC126530295 [Dermacentor andersoni]
MAQFALCMFVASVPTGTMITLGVGRVRCHAFAAMTVFLVLAAVTGVQARCPPKSGVLSTCDYTVCSPAGCAAQGMECCPKPCGGSWCVKGIGPPPEFSEICPPEFTWAQDCLEPRNNTTCEQLNCLKVGSICCRNGCKENYCYLVPGSSK